MSCEHGGNLRAMPKTIPCTFQCSPARGDPKHKTPVQSRVPCREEEQSFGEELHFKIMYVPSIFPPTSHLCEHVCPIDNLLIPASSQGWHDPDNGCPTVAHTPQLWPRRTTFGTSTTPGVELCPGSASPRATLSIQLVEITRNPEVGSK